MSNQDNQIVPWNPSDLVVIPTTADTPSAIVEFGRATLTKRDIQSIIAGFDAQGYEMVSTFVWTKAAATMKKQVATLGMEFVGEMLGRPDLNDDSDPTTAIADHEVITLAEDLGMITATQALRLKHSLQIVTHFASLDEKEAEEEAMQKEEAVSLLRTCVTSILGKPRFEAAMQFADFRKRLGEQTLSSGSGDVTAIQTSPYFFVRTTLSVLLSMIKTQQGATLEHAVGNCMVLVPSLWGRLREPERWQIGQAYAEVNASGNRLASGGLKKALLDVHGFDFVPETLRSSTYTEAAAKVLSAHFSMNNFFNERDPMQSLANLGTTIPMPAFAKCMEAALAVRLGNVWGEAWSAQSAANQLLSSLRPTQWEYYFNECLWRDRTVLDKLTDESKPVSRWCGLVAELVHSEFVPKDKNVASLLAASRSGNSNLVMRTAREIRSAL
ncbi:hypothetical protein KBY96_00690 [Cyanobium sp. ATX 6A2]|uniref:hypothetical protein n=1 Tax=Cyanobium sp. ATX 6A2 TaxID=2823700 RepID=UPI0020CF3783|nr:hypothetical protein [Cyanobium sp. ATX 6A2]MCP9886458.1 hypothetical protein [Cyanobium sp. ATX 6A2]